MKKVLKFIKRLFIGIILVLYFSVAILVSTLLLNKNDYGITEFDGKQLIIVDESMETKTFKKGQLVIVKRVDFKNIKSGDEVFIYSKNEDNTIKVIVATVDEAVTEADNYKYVKIKNDGTSWGEKFIAGKADVVYDDWGKYIAFITSKWIFFILLIVPCFFILLYEIYLIIITIKYGDEDEDEEEIARQIDVKEMNKEKAKEQEEVLIPLQVPDYSEPRKEEVKMPVFDDAYSAPVVNNFVPIEEVKEVPRSEIPLRDLQMERPKVDIEDSTIELPRKEEPKEVETVITPTKTYLQAPTFNFANLPKPSAPKVPSAPSEPSPSNEPTYSRYDRTLDNKYVEPKEEPKESAEDVQARLDALLQEVSKLRDELNNK